jgi:hypothetical protein
MGKTLEKKVPDWIWIRNAKYSYTHMLYLIRKGLIDSRLARLPDGRIIRQIDANSLEAYRNRFPNAEDM